MDPLRDLRGIVTVLNTPFTKTNEVSLDALSKNVQYAIDSGVCGFLVPAMASEVESLNQNEKLSIVKSVIETCDSKKKVIAGTSSPTVDKSLQIAKDYLDMGCDAILVSEPYSNPETFRQIIQQFNRLDPHLLVIQDWSVNGYGIPPSLILELFEEFSSFRAIKIEVVPAGSKYTEILNLTNGKIHVSGGWAVTQMIEGLDRGVHAFMPTGMHEIYVEIYDRYMKGDRRAAIELFRKILPVLAFSNQHLDISIYFFKKLLYRQGVYPTSNVRSPTIPFDDIHAKVSDELIENVLNLRK